MEIWIVTSNYGMVMPFSTKEKALEFVREEANKNNFKGLYIEDNQTNIIRCEFTYKNPFTDGNSFGHFLVVHHIVDKY